jgi:2-polyprenyl-3-methyl-5-hydroxy-6-metoxy-1,4-benzoquinol methylase
MVDMTDYMKSMQNPDPVVRNHAMKRKILKILDKRPKGKLLDVGCVDGTFISELKEQGWEVAGIELQQHLVDKAKANGLRVVCHNAQLPFFDFANEKFDVVIAGEIIEHMINDDLFLHNCFNVLNDDGILILTTPNLHYSYNRAMILFGKEPTYVVDDMHFKVYTYYKIMHKVEKLFNVKSVVGSHVLFSKNKMKGLGDLFEWLGNYFPEMSAHFIIVAKKRRDLL